MLTKVSRTAPASQANVPGLGSGTSSWRLKSGMRVKRMASIATLARMRTGITHRRCFGLGSSSSNNVATGTSSTPAEVPASLRWAGPGRTSRIVVSPPMEA